MIAKQSVPQTSLLQTVSLTAGLVLGGTAATILIALVIMATAQLNLGPAIANLPNYLPESWYAAIVYQAQVMGFPLQAETSAYWYMSRVSALLGYFFMWGSVVWGLLLSTKLVKSVIPPAYTMSMHEFLSWVGLGFSTFHAVILLGDKYIEFSLASIFIPFLSSFKPFWVGIGTLSFYLYALVLISFYFRKKIGQKTWRKLHYISFLTFLMVLVHGFMAGTDSALSLVKMMYLGSGASVMFLTFYRVLTSKWANAGSKVARADR